MKSFQVRVAVVVAAAGVALSACGPVQAGAAAIVGKERISTSDLDTKIQEFRKDLAANKITEEQLGLRIPLSQLILLRLANSKQYVQLGSQQGITVTQRDIDDIVAAQGGQTQIDTALLQSGVPLSVGREFISSVIIQQKLIDGMGAGQDQQSQQLALQKLTQEIDTKVPVRFNPRYGKFDPQQGFVPDERFGRVPAPAPAQAAAGDPAAPPAGDPAAPPAG
ncbi:hypothetical protein GCM10023194_73240 [Planotetraspora phitsanulokensis]|uniref:Lipoprotein n=1 Tax=Planotetraspora phitsanulokensis TaxID=575192 RepID=A0A8J3XDD8_9ACTN|nr:hypothetical protein [Planotetraspora phitsanulokensis]GII37177.1 hypothetical protein Pph01_21800 [Planotetraspora phitsanulokensis]